MIQNLVLFEQLHDVGVELAQLTRHELLLETICISAPRKADLVGIKGHEFGVGYAEGDKSVEFTFSRFSGAAKYTAMKGEQVELTGRAGVPEIIACFRWVFAELLEESRQHRANVADVKLRAKEAMDRAEERDFKDFKNEPMDFFMYGDDRPLDIANVTAASKLTLCSYCNDQGDECPYCRRVPRSV